MRSEFYWGFLSSLSVCIALFAYQVNRSPFPGHNEAGKSLSFGLLPFFVIYFVVGVIMLFRKKSASFAKGLLLSALIIFAVLLCLVKNWISLDFMY